MSVQAIQSTNMLSIYLQNNMYRSAKATDNAPMKTEKGATAKFSPEGMAASFRKSLGIDQSKETISIEDIFTSISKDRAAVEKYLHTTLNELGIDENALFELTSNYTGRIVVRGDFQGKEALEDTLNNDRQFSNTFRRLSANSSLYEAWRRHEEFMNAYEVDPEAAVAQFISLFNDSSQYHFTLSYSNGHAETRVDVV